MSYLLLSCLVESLLILIFFPLSLYLQLSADRSLLDLFDSLLSFTLGLLPGPVTIHANILEISFSFPPEGLKHWFPVQFTINQSSLSFLIVPFSSSQCVMLPYDKLASLISLIMLCQWCFQHIHLLLNPHFSVKVKVS